MFVKVCIFFFTENSSFDGKRIMSVVCASSEGWVLNHFELITKLYSDVTSCSDKCTSYAYEESLFKIITPFLFTSQSKKSTSNSNSSKNNSTPDKLYYSDSEVSVTNDAIKLNHNINFS